MTIDQLKFKLLQAKAVRDAANSNISKLQANIDSMQAEMATLITIERLLTEYVTYRKTMALSRVSETMTRGLQQVFGGDISASMGEDNGSKSSTSNAKLMAIQVTTNNVTQDVRRGCGRSVRVVIDYLLWLDLFSSERATKGYRPFVCWDEPFLALHPSRYPKVQALLTGLEDIGVQVVVCTNQVGMIPDGALTHTLTRQS